MRILKRMVQYPRWVGKFPNMKPVSFASRTLWERKFAVIQNSSQHYTLHSNIHQYKNSDIQCYSSGIRRITIPLEIVRETRRPQQ